MALTKLLSLSFPCHLWLYLSLYSSFWIFLFFPLLVHPRIMNQSGRIWVFWLLLLIHFLLPRIYFNRNCLLFWNSWFAFPIVRYVLEFLPWISLLPVLISIMLFFWCILLFIFVLLKDKLSAIQLRSRFFLCNLWFLNPISKVNWLNSIAISFPPALILLISIVIIIPFVDFLVIWSN